VSDINFQAINENFPVAGQDNDTQIFRDNFDSIKNNFRLAKNEIADLQEKTARTDRTNDFNLFPVTRAIFQNSRERVADLVSAQGVIVADPFTIDYENGNYQILRIGASINLNTLNFPGDPNLPNESSSPLGVGKVVLELYASNPGNSGHTINFSTSGGTVIKKAAGFPTPFILTSTSNPHIIEIWRHSPTVIFIRSLGLFA
jgi:hypothetical protein